MYKRQTLKDTLHIENAAGQELVWGEDFTVSVVYAEDMPEYGTFQEAWEDTETIFALNLIELTDEAAPDKPIALFCITFTEASRTKLEGGQRLYISYRTLLNRQGVTSNSTMICFRSLVITGYLISRCGSIT